MQLHELRQYVARRGWQVFAEYVDTGCSGALASRPQLDRLIRDARLHRRSGRLPASLSTKGLRQSQSNARSSGSVSGPAWLRRFCPPEPLF
jgi:hypothetical protein